MLAIQKTIRAKQQPYAYLEIGSYMGGSIQPYLFDDRCSRIYSIDLRPAIPPDVRGVLQVYPENSTQNMLSRLREVSAEGVSKIKCFDADASTIEPKSIDERPTICLIDGEHTDKAVVADFAFCKTVLADSGIICFHDSNIVYGGLTMIIEQLKAERVQFNAFVLPLHVFVFEFGGCTVHDSADIAAMLKDNYVQYLAGLKSMEHYRDVYNSRGVRFLRFLHRRLLDIQNPKRISHHFKKP
ncbi:MAG: hypothetical protein HW412_1762 [Bacteroidetes bacterium]|nr:hypothetical protein [Bacteroidota bacterium]